MSKRKKQTTRPTTSTVEQTAPPIRIVATPKARESRTTPERSARPLVFGKDTYRWLGGGFLLIVLGFVLMMGGRGDDPTVFDADVIYSFRKITLAPIIILTGLGVTTYAIFKK